MVFEKLIIKGQGRPSCDYVGLSCYKDDPLYIFLRVAVNDLDNTNCRLLARILRDTGNGYGGSGFHHLRCRLFSWGCEDFVRNGRSGQR